ncbi:hypothetical protein M378DRAFT_601145 [Amanita muscaria Koide BX008]|uniref:C2H2-type domain-containing protein n=1 Tax=Amanita muscaria (strain Koide BX008) TaxID=946122 RepID=A0A0C2XLV3_AMAMK|nr:hypothetical protein M378DRAFT_601145 [Amanita muscaria Koide BX008]
MAFPSTTLQPQSPPTSLDSLSSLSTCSARFCASPEVPRACIIDSSHVDAGGLRGEKKIILPPFRHISRIAAGGHHDPTGDIWRSRRTSPPVTICDPPPTIPKKLDTTSSLASTKLADLDTPTPPAINDDDISVLDDRSNDSPDDDDDDASVSSEDAPLHSGWDACAVVTNGHDGRVMYRCLWDLGYQCCNYTAKRQLVKRHIENTHMQIKRFKCQYCTRRFAQKSSRNIHQNTHTGAKPHPCMFQCGKWFRDPSKRTRHAYRVHGYEPKPRRSIGSHR